MKKSPYFNHVAASHPVLSLAQPEESLNTADRTPLDLLPLSKLFPRVDENRLHIVIQAPPKGDPISFLSDNITDFVQSARVLMRKKKKTRGEMGLLLIFFPLSPSLINTITGFHRTTTRINKAMAPDSRITGEITLPNLFVVQHKTRPIAIHMLVDLSIIYAHSRCLPRVENHQVSLLALIFSCKRFLFNSTCPSTSQVPELQRSVLSASLPSLPLVDNRISYPIRRVLLKM